MCERPVWSGKNCKTFNVKASSRPLRSIIQELRVRLVFTHTKYEKLSLFFLYTQTPAPAPALYRKSKPHPIPLPVKPEVIESLRFSSLCHALCPRIAKEVFGATQDPLISHHVMRNVACTDRPSSWTLQPAWLSRRPSATIGPCGAETQRACGQLGHNKYSNSTAITSCGFSEASTTAAGAKTVGSVIGHGTLLYLL